MPILKHGIKLGSVQSWMSELKRQAFTLLATGEEAILED